MLHKLNLACGDDIRPSNERERWTHLELLPLPGVDVVHDLREFPWPLADDSFDEIIAWDVLEHLPDTVGTLEEIWRVLKPGGVVEIRVPYWNSPHQFNDPTHVKAFNERTFEFFEEGSEHQRKRPYYSKARFRRESLSITVGAIVTKLTLNDGFAQRVALWISKRVGAVTQMMTFRLRAIK